MSTETSSELRAELVPRGGARCLELAPSGAGMADVLERLGWAYESVDKRRDASIDHERDLADLHGIDSGAYELVLALHGLAATADPTAAMDEIARVVEPGGRALLGVAAAAGEELGLRFAAVERLTRPDGDGVLVCRAHGTVRAAPAEIGRLAPGTAIEPVSVDAIAEVVTVKDPAWTGRSAATAIGRGAEAVDQVALPEPRIVGAAEDAERHRAAHRPLARYSARRLFMISVPRCSLAGPDLVAVQDGHYLTETAHGTESFADRHVFVRGAEGWPALAAGATHATIETPVLALGRRSGDGYLGWMTEVVPRLLVAREQGDLASLPVVMRPARQPFQTRTLEWLGVWPWFVTEDVVHVERAVLPSAPREASPDLLAAVRRFQAERVPVSAEATPPLVYATRRDARRQVANEPAIRRALGELGFATVFCDELDVERQVAHFAQADAVVGAPGDALANLVFARPGTRVVELCPSDRPGPSPFWTLANLAGLRHTLAIAGVDRGRLVVDVDALRTLLG